MKKLMGALLAALCVLALLPRTAGAVELPLTSRAALLMEKTTGEILFAQNEHEALDPASVARLFICSTNSSVTPDTFSASATAASLPEDTHTLFSSSSTVIFSPSAKKT